MKLEEEIQQKRFASPRAKLSVNLIYTYHWLVSKNHDFFKDHDITMQQFNILRILRGQYPNPCTIQLLKDRMLDKQSDVSRLVDRLVLKGHVERQVCEKDRRKMDVLISPSGLQLLETLDPLVRRMDDHASHLSESEVEALNDLLDKMRG
jgi:DNA-binding MarR family transcriptional regulator